MARELRAREIGRMLTVEGELLSEVLMGENSDGGGVFGAPAQMRANRGSRRGWGVSRGGEECVARAPASSKRKGRAGLEREVMRRVGAEEPASNGRVVHAREARRR